ncbi:S8 family serine peptidase [bacterium]|nr:S8 family serine peptidase [bacterium]
MKKTVNRLLSASGTRLGAALLCSLLVALSMGTTATADTVPVLVREADSVDGSVLKERAAALSTDRQKGVVLELDEAEAAALIKAGIDATIRKDFDLIQLRAGELSTRGRNGLSSAKDGIAASIKLVQFSGPPEPADLEALEAGGARIIHYVPQNAYLVWCGKDAATESVLKLRSRAANPVRFVGDYLPEYAVAPQVKDKLSGSEELAVTIQLYTGNPEAASLAKKAFAQIRRQSSAVIAEEESVLDGRYRNIRVQASSKAIEGFAKLPVTVMIEPHIPRRLYGERQGQSMANQTTAGGVGPSGPGYLSWLTGKGFTTTTTDYPIVVVVDDGVDNGTINPANSEFRVGNVAAAASRVIFSALPPGSALTVADGRAGHGNINASIIGGYNNSTGSAFEDTQGFNYGLGISPHGRLANIKIFTDAGSFDSGTSDQTMVRDYYNRGARISSNSWGSDVAGAYTSDSQVYDSITRDADSQSAGNQEMFFVFSAGNAGSNNSTMGSPGTGKNVLAVGAAESSNPASSAGDGCNLTSSDGNNNNDIATFSSRGPTTDLRAKPEIVAPGTFVMGAAPLANFTGEGVCGNAIAGDAHFPLGTNYTWSSGTSHSCPGVAGYASLIGAYLARVHGFAVPGAATGIQPSAALLKAYAVHGTRYLTGTGAGGNLPGNGQGFGFAEMNLAFSQAAKRQIVDQTTLLTANGSYELVGAVDQASEPLRITLCWTDPPGSLSGNSYINDLDLVVEVNGQTYYGNNFNGGTSISGGNRDVRNNTECVFLPANAASGDMKVRVEARTIAGDGVPGNGISLDQDFALVVYNMTEISSKGRVVLDREVYNGTTPIGVTVLDSDIAGAGNQTVALSTTGGDLEIFSAIESGDTPGLFTVSVPSASGSVSESNGTLEVSEGDTITALYLDANDGAGGTNVSVSDTATVDINPPSVSEVSFTNISAQTASVSFLTDENTVATVELGTACGSPTMTFGGGRASIHSIAIDGLLPETTYFLRITAVDDAGNSTTDDNGGACYTFTTPVQPDYLTEQFAGTSINENFDLDNTQLTFTPLQGGTGYTVCRESNITAFPVSPTSHTVLTLGDDEFVQRTITGSTFPFFGQNYSSVFVSSNGFVSFGSGAATASETVSDHFSRPQISALFDDLFPSSNVRYTQLADQIVITYIDVVEYNLTTKNNVQIQLFFDGRIVLTYLNVDAQDGIVGLSDGNGVPSDFAESNLSDAHICASTGGELVLDRAAYQCNGEVGIQVGFVDLIGLGTVTVTVVNTSTNDQVTVDLTETGTATGVFIGSVTLEEGGASADNILQVVHGNSITATYDNDGTVLTDTAAIDCVAPVISNVSLSGTTTTTASVSFQTNEEATGTFSAGPTCGTASFSGTGGSGLTAHSVTVSGLSPETAYRGFVTATDAAGNVATFDNSGQCLAFTTAAQVRHFTEIFDGDAFPFDLDNSTLVFTPASNPSGYTVCLTPNVTAYPEPISGSTTFTLGDDAFRQITLSGGRTFPFYGASYSSVYLGSNGYITFVAGDDEFDSQLGTHFNAPRVSFLFNDMSPSGSSTLGYKQLTDRLVITFNNVPSYDTTNSNNVQIHLLFDGTIRITYLRVDDTFPIVGLSSGQGVPTDYESEDFSTEGDCTMQPTVTPLGWMMF